MSNRDRQAAFKAAMRAKGMVQVTEWIPSEHRDLYRAVARALREGETVTIGTPPPRPASIVTSNSTPSGKARSTNNADRKAQDEARQKRYAEQWDAATETITALDVAGKGHDARITGRQKQTIRGMLGEQIGVERCTGIIRKGSRYQALEFSIWENVGLRMAKPPGWRLVPAEMIKAARRRVAELHPDKGGPGGDEYQAAMATLDALRGRTAS